MNHLIEYKDMVFYSEEREQMFFDRKRTPRLEKKLHVGDHLLLLVRTSSTKDLTPLVGNQYATLEEAKDNFMADDALIDASYVNGECRKDLFLGFAFSSYSQDGVCSTDAIWEVRPENKEHLNALIDEIENICEQNFDTTEVCRESIEFIY